MAHFPAAFVPHGGGPLPLLGAANHKGLVAFMKQLPSHLPRPKSIVLVSAHWEEKDPTVTSAAQPDLLYDYYGFPPEAYDVKYTAPGAPELASQVVELLRSAGFSATGDSKRGWDHGMFVPMKVMYPDADIPVVQLSLLNSLDPQAHIRMGQALQPLRRQDTLILGSGITFHNMSAFRSTGFEGKAAGPLAGQDFDTWLADAVTKHKGADRAQLLSNWSSAPGARNAHPREEHLLPLMVVAGAAGDDEGTAVYQEELMGSAVSGYVFGQLQESM
eukprot:jgi/Chrzof1/3521/Cz12g28150.t1